VIESHQLPRQQGGSQTRAGADDFPDEVSNYFADDLANYFPDDFRRLRRCEQLKTSLTHLSLTDALTAAPSSAAS